VLVTEYQVEPGDTLQGRLLGEVSAGYDVVPVLLERHGGRAPEPFPSDDARLEPDQYHRYRTAHRCAARYCRRLEHRFVSRGQARIEAMVRELRRFYRLGSNAKLRHALA